MYGKQKYGVCVYADETQDGGGAGEYYTDLLPLLPPFMAEKKEIRGLYEAQGFQIGQLRHDLEDTRDQCCPLTATWGLTRWEKAFGVESNLSLTYEQRRELLAAKLRGQGTTTIQMIREAAAAFSGGDVDILEDTPITALL